MAELSKGIRLASDSGITLNNRLFEDPKGTLLFTFRPDAPSPAITGDRLLLGSDKGYINVFLRHDASGGGYRVVAESNNSSSKSTVESPLTAMKYLEEVTIGVVYDTTVGDLKLLVSATDSTLADNPSDQSTYFAATGGTDSATKDTAASIGLKDFTGFVGRLATYSTTTSDTALAGFVGNPNSWPTANRVHYLDAANLTAANRVDSSQPSVQMLSFGAAQLSGVITVDNVNVLINANDSGAAVAQKVGKVLSESTVFKTQVEKQTITFEYKG